MSGNRVVPEKAASLAVVPNCGRDLQDKRLLCVQRELNVSSTRESSKWLSMVARKSLAMKRAGASAPRGVGVLEVPSFLSSGSTSCVVKLPLYHLGKHMARLRESRKPSQTLESQENSLVFFQKIDAVVYTDLRHMLTRLSIRRRWFTR
jgi:hypothetical protein